MRTINLSNPNEVRFRASGPRGLQGPAGEQGVQGPAGPKGDPGSGVTILGSLNDPSELPVSGNTVGDAYLIDDDLYVWTEDEEWENVGPIRGPQGVQGEQGIQGIQGVKGDKGDKGDTGDTGPAGSDATVTEEAVASAGAVMTTTNQTVAGVKTFTAFPVTPEDEPTTNYQVANKKYVDDEIAAIPVLSEISESEIDTGTATDPKSITGRRAKYIIDEARDGTVKSTTTNNVTVADTAPVSPSVGDLWVDIG